MKHMMLDLETLGVEPGCMILSIGAVGFSPYEKGIRTVDKTHDFYTNVNIKSQQLLGLGFNAGTLEWWMEQSNEAKEMLFKDEKSIRTACQNLVDFWDDNQYEYVWGHGSIFDVAIIEYIFRKLDIETPWKFYNIRDTRTLFDLGKFKIGKREGTHHYAYDDAVHQALGVQLAFRSLNLVE